MKKQFTLKDLTSTQAIRLAELAFSNRIENPYVYRTTYEGLDFIYIFADNNPPGHPAHLCAEDFEIEGLGKIQGTYDYLEIDADFNVFFSGGAICNMAVIYALIFSWGYQPGYDVTGLFPASKFKPKTLAELETQPSESLQI